MRVSATFFSQSAKKRFCAARLSKRRPLTALFCAYFTPASICRGVGYVSKSRFPGCGALFPISFQVLHIGRGHREMNLWDGSDRQSQESNLPNDNVHPD